MGAVRFYKPLYDPLQDLLFEGACGLQRVFLHPFHGTTALLKDTHNLMHLREEFARLSTENATLKRELQTLRPLSHENEALKKVLHIPAAEALTYRAVRVLASPYDGLHRFFLIDVDSQESLVKDQAVVVEEGIVGRLEKVGKYTARVLLLTDVNSRIPVMTTLSDQKAILAGDGTFLPTLIYINDVRKIQPGEKVVTSGLGGFFPPGYPVGIVESTENGHIKVRPYAALHSMEWVQILKALPPGFYEEVSSGLEEEEG